MLDLESCAEIETAFALLGKRWTGLIVDLLLQRPARFAELHHAVDGLSKRVLSERLRELESLRLVDRIVDPGPPIAVTYRLTERGQGLRPALDALRAWAGDGQPRPPARKAARDRRLSTG